MKLYSTSGNLSKSFPKRSQRKECICNLFTQHTTNSDWRYIKAENSVGGDVNPRPAKDVQTCDL